jgi:hypothetical protein
MKRVRRHIIIPAIVPAFFFVIAAMPVDVLGCRNRGLMAFSIALIGGVAALGGMIIAVIRRAGGDQNTGWWAASALVLAIPAVVIIFIAQ